METNDLFARLAALALYLAAGGAAYLLLLNRVLLGMIDGGHKLLIIGGSFAVTLLVSLAGGILLGPAWPWLLVPLALLAIAAAAEVSRVIVRRRSQGAAPVERAGTKVALGKPVTTTALTVARYELFVPTWQGQRLRVVHLTDLHVTDRLPFDYYKDVMARVRAEDPDLLLYTGDFITKACFAPHLPEILSLAHGKSGTIAVLGNHDHWAGAAEVACAVRSVGITLLGNQCRQVQVDGHNLSLCGCESPEAKYGWRPPRLKPGRLALGLTHSPDNIYRLSGLGMTAVFAGHYHAGQMRVPGLGALVVPSRFGRRFDHGHFVVDGTHLFVSAGVGASAPPLRLYCPPDFFVVDLYGCSHSDRGR